MLLVHLNLLIQRSSIIGFHRRDHVSSSEKLQRFIFYFWVLSLHSFEGFIASFDNLLLQIRQSGQGASESTVEINPYFKYDSLCWRLKEAFLFFDCRPLVHDA